MHSTENPRVVGYSPEHGLKWRGEIPAIVTDGRSTLHVVLMDVPVRLVRVPKAEARHMKPLLRKGREYDVKRAARKFLKMGRVHGINKTARRALKALTA